MAAVVFPRNILGSQSQASIAGLPSWVTTVPVSTYASIPYAAGKSMAAQGYGTEYGPAWQMCNSYSGLTWNEAYGAGGGAILTGGGHAVADFPYVWVFDGSLPGWVAVSLTGANGTDAYQWAFANGSEYSRTQGNMPGDATLYGEGYWKPLASLPAYGYPFSNLIAYGECAPNHPFGFHSYDYIFPLAAGQMGVGSKGGWAVVLKSSITRNSGVYVPWGHYIDAATGVWSRWPERMPTGLQIGQYGGGWMKSHVEGNYAYMAWGGDASARTILRVDLTTGAMTPTLAASTDVCASAGAMTGIPGTTLLFTACPANMGFLYNPSNKVQMWVRGYDIANPSGGWADVQMTNNTMPAGRGDVNKGFSQAPLCWVPEVGKFAIFGVTLNADEASYGAWPGGDNLTTNPLKLFWITPPSNVQTNWKTQPWTVEEEVLSVPVTDTKALSKANRGSGLIGFAYRSFFYSSKLRCFIHLASSWNDMCFFIRSNKVP